MPAPATIWVDGEPATALPLPDRGLEFGDGLFETLLLKAGRPLHLELHLQRLRAGLRALGFPDCETTVTGRLHAITREISSTSPAWGVLRLTVTRGAGPRGYAPPPDPLPRVVITVTPLERDVCAQPAPAWLGVATMRWSLQPALAGIKHLNRIEQVLAAREAQQAGVDEVVMRDPDDNVISVAAGNLFFYQDGMLHTPGLDRCGIAGTRRRLVLERWAPELGLTVREGRFTLEEMEDSEELFFCNSVLGPRPVARLRDREWRNFPVCDAVRNLCWSEP